MLSPKTSTMHPNPAPLTRPPKHNQDANTVAHQGQKHEKAHVNPNLDLRHLSAVNACRVACGGQSAVRSHGSSVIDVFVKGLAREFGFFSDFAGAEEPDGMRKEDPNLEGHAEGNGG